MPKNNNYLLVSVPQQHILRLYNSSTGLPVSRKGPVMRVEATAVAVEPCADPFLFVGDVSGTITMWRYRVGCGDGGPLPAVVTAGKGMRKGGEKGHGGAALPQANATKMRRDSVATTTASTSTAAEVRGVAAASMPNLKRQTRQQHTLPAMAEIQPQFEKVAGLVMEKGVPVGTIVVNSMNHQQFHCLLRVQRIGQQLPEANTIKKWAAAALAGARQRDEYHVVSSNTSNATAARSACAVMLLVSFPCDRLVILCIQPSKCTPRTYKLVPMLVINGACRLRQLSAGTAFCVDNTRCPTLSCTCEEGFVRIVACTAAFPLLAKDEGKRRPHTPPQAAALWNVMATLPVPCGGIPCSLAWSPDMRFLVVVTEEGTLYQWRRAHLLHKSTHRGDGNYRDDDDSIAGQGFQDEVDEWRAYFEREKERQMRRYRTEGRTANAEDDSLSGSGGLWSSAWDSAARSSEPSLG
ncbi:hypothetical protein DQ04_18531000 [Trypanosoma grayi]|uniref:hypothetical protein n=1 Tax=Trypanosoma grayi TaxID=71804 RepID=UPI0004F40AE5|nr:hypothetical protein DQ04_18531000 [Trypanosoma grayi]KEG05777.1 hypothetical protein DQ04_18531000 [Trypanosoma grayi]